MRKRILGVCCLLAMTGLTFSQGRREPSSFVPKYIKLQFAGSIGFLSLGVGFESPNKKFQGDFFYGYVPESVGGVTIHSVTGKLTWMAISRNFEKQVKWDILTASVLVNYAFGKQYFLFSPDKYPYSYYGFPTAAHGAIFVGGGITKKRLGLYYEIGTTGKDMLSYVKNTRALPFTDILNIGTGIRFAIR